MQKTSDFIIARAASGAYNTDSSLIANYLILERSKFNAHTIEAHKTLVDTFIPNSERLTDQKVTKRLLKMIAFINESFSRDGKVSLTYLEANAAIATAAIAMLSPKAGTVHQGQVRFIAGVQSRTEVEGLNGVSKAKINKFVGLGGASGTVNTQVSTMFKEKGIFQALGLIEQVGKGLIKPDYNKIQSSPFITAYCAALNMVTGSDFETLALKMSEKN